MYARANQNSRRSLGGRAVLAAHSVGSEGRHVFSSRTAGAAACLHLAATVRGDVLDGVWIAANYIAETAGYPTQISALDGRLQVPQSPGLGVAVNETELGSEGITIQ